jgi:hypothetical protein
MKMAGRFFSLSGFWEPASGTMDALNRAMLDASTLLPTSASSGLT